MLALVTVCASQNLVSKPAHFEIFGLCNDEQYLGNEKVFTPRVPFGETIGTFTFPNVRLPTLNGKNK